MNRIMIYMLLLISLMGKTPLDDTHVEIHKTGYHNSTVKMKKLKYTSYTNS